MPLVFFRNHAIATEHEKLTDKTNCCLRHWLGLVPDITLLLTNPSRNAVAPLHNTNPPSSSPPRNAAAPLYNTNPPSSANNASRPTRQRIRLHPLANETRPDKHHDDITKCVAAHGTTQVEVTHDHAFGLPSSSGQGELVSFRVGIVLSRVENFHVDLGGTDSFGRFGGADSFIVARQNLCG